MEKAKGFEMKTKKEIQAEQIAADVAAFIANNGKIEIIEPEGADISQRLAFEELAEGLNDE